jgi:hypothetical protein
VPRYYFAVVNGHRLRDPSSLDCANDDQAKIHGKEIARQIAREVPSSVQRRRVSVVDTEGHEIALIEVVE